VVEGVRLGSEEWYNAAVRYGKIKMQEPPGPKLKTRWCRKFVIEKINRLFEPITPTQKNWIALFAYMCSVKYPIFMHYVTITSSNMYSNYTLKTFVLCQTNPNVETK
jgi:hypothetical protein